MSHPRPRSNRAPKEIVAAITEKAGLVREAATALTDRIQFFESYLGKLPGRVETYIYAPHPDRDSPDDSLELGISFTRQGKEWLLQYGSYHPGANGDFNPVDWYPLKDAPIKIKIAAVSMFPDLLTNIETSQDQLVGRLQKAAADFDVFVGSLPVNLIVQAKGGK